MLFENNTQKKFKIIEIAFIFINFLHNLLFLCCLLALVPETKGPKISCVQKFSFSGSDFLSSQNSFQEKEFKDSLLTYTYIFSLIPQVEVNLEHSSCVFPSNSCCEKRGLLLQPNSFQF